MHAWSGSLLASLLAGAASVSTAPPAARGDLIELEVAAVLPLDPEAGTLLVLRQKGAETMLPIFIGRNEGAALDQRLRRGPPRRPGAAELLERTIAALGGRVAHVAIEGEQAAVLRARVTLVQGERRFEIDARPSDSVTLAVGAGAPIFATRQVLSEVGLTRDDLARVHGDRAPPKQGASEGPKLSF
jgi:bifunctional DNase/RNase